MSKPKHTPGPWRKYFTDLGNYTPAWGIEGFYGPDGNCSLSPVCHVYRHKEDPEKIKESEANAQRIVDCVNACEGINPKAVSSMISALQEAESLLSVANTEHFEIWLQHTYQSIASALKLARGEE